MTSGGASGRVCCGKVTFRLARPPPARPPVPLPPGGGCTGACARKKLPPSDMTNTTATTVFIGPPSQIPVLLFSGRVPPRSAHRTLWRIVLAPGAARGPGPHQDAGVYSTYMNRRVFLGLPALGAATVMARRNALAAPPGSGPASKRQRMLQWLAGKTEPNYTPAAFFLHFGPKYKNGSAAAGRHLEFFRQTDMDFVKIQFEQTYERQ